jgi:hypothetical protein
MLDSRAGRITLNLLAVLAFSLGGAGAVTMWNPFTFRSLEGLRFGVHAVRVFGCAGLFAWAAGEFLEGPRLAFALMASNITALLAMTAVRLAVGWHYNFGPPDDPFGPIAHGEPGSSAVAISLWIFVASALAGVMSALCNRDRSLGGYLGLAALAIAMASVVAGVGFFVGAMIDPGGPSLVQDGGATTGMLLGAAIGVYIWKSKTRFDVRAQTRGS